MPRRSLPVQLALGAALALAVAGPLVPTARAQVDAPVLYFKRGQLWNAYYYAKTGAPFNNWRRIDVGMDWPGFDPELLQTDVGGAPSHLLTGGLYFSAKDARGRVIAIDDFSIYASSTTPESDAKYRVLEHRKRYGADGNFWLKTDPNDAEEVITSAWERNTRWTPQFAGDRQNPIRVRREVRQWSGSQRDENYALVEYTIKNVGDSTIFDAVAMATYAFAMNNRSQAVLFPQLTTGARNVRFVYNPALRQMTGFTTDFPDTPENEAHGWRAGFGPNGAELGGGEYLAPAYVGLKFLAVTRNKAGLTNAITNYAWLPADPNQDQQGPLVGQSGFDQQYAVLRDPRTGRNASNSPAATFMTRSRIWSLFSMGPWDIAPGDSIRVAYAEAIGGVSYAEATGLTLADAGSVAQRGNAALNANAARAQFAYDHRYNVPDPPPAPPFTVGLYVDAATQKLGNQIAWADTYDAHADADYAGAEANDLAGYRLYRSVYLPIGPWELVKDIPKGDPVTFAGGTYTVVDTTAKLGNGYYYALTAYDTGHAAWPVDPAARFPETANTNRVPVLESSLFANRSERPFLTTIPPGEALSNVIVVPNPFVQASGSQTPGLGDDIQFVNVPSPATIRIYTLRGTLVATVRHTEASGIARWSQRTDGEQFVESGIYVYHIKTPDGRSVTGKLAIVR